MSDIPNSYEEAQKLIKKNSYNKRSSILKSLVISVLGILIIFCVWIFYPIPAPDFAIRSLLPENTAISVEVHKPAKLIKLIDQNKYIHNLYTLPIWSTLEREYQLESPHTLLDDSKAFMADLKKRADDIIGVRNILAAAGGISFTEHEDPVYNSIVWLDNIAFLVLKVSSYFNAPSEYNGIKYYKIQLNSKENFYLTFSATHQRAVLISTQLKSLCQFITSSRHLVDTELNNRSDIIELSLFPEKLPANNLFYIKEAQKSEISIRWSIDEITSKGELNLNLPNAKQHIVKTEKNRLVLTNNQPSLSINLNLPVKTISDTANVLLSNLANTSNPFLKPLTNKKRLTILNQLNDNISLMISEPENENTNILKYTHLYFEVKNEQKAHKCLNSDISSIIDYYRKSDDLGLRILSSQLKLKTTPTASTLSLPLFPEIVAEFSTKQDIAYAEIKARALPSHKPKIEEQSNQILTTKWRYSQQLTGALNNSVPASIKNQTLLYYDKLHKIKVIDIINFLSSSNFFVLNFYANFDKMHYTTLTFNASSKLN